MRPRPAVLVLCLGIAAAVAGVVARFVVTDRQAITKCVEGAFEAAKGGDWDAVADALADDVTWGGATATKAAVVERARTNATRAPSSSWRLTIDDISIDGDRATVSGKVSLAIPAALSDDGFHREGRVELVKRDGAWKISRIEETGRLPGRQGAVTK